MIPSNMLERIQIAKDALSGFSESDLRLYVGCIGSEIPEKYRQIDQRLCEFTREEKTTLVGDLLQSYNW